MLALLDTYKDVTLNNATCKGALDEIYRLWGLSWIFVTAYGRKQIYVAFAASATSLFKYGKGQGLRAITVEQKDTASLATRIYPYGSTENLPARWYNEHPLDDEEKYIDNYQYIPNLMLPPSLWHGGKPDGNYVEDADAIAKYGLRPKTIYFEGGEYEKIMPSISGLTAKDIRDAKTEIGDTENVPSTTFYPDSTRMDRTLTGDSTTDNGVKPEDSGSSDDTEAFSFDADSKAITIVNGELGGETTASDPGETIYTDKTFFPLASVSVTKIAQYYLTLSNGGVSVSLDSATTALLAKFSLTPILCAYAPQANTEIETLAIGETIAMPANSEGWDADVSLVSLFADAEAIYKVYQSQMDDLPFDVKLYLGFVIDYKFGTTATVPDIPVTINLSAGGGECTRGVTQIANRFTVKIKQIGFDIMDCKKAANDNRQLNMKSGLCAGYSFNILKTEYNASDDSWTLTCYRTTDTDLKIAFPNIDRHIAAEDEFVLTGIEMPDIYVYAAMEKLYEQALLTLAELSKPKMVYVPEIDKQKMAASPQVLHAGMILMAEDTDLDLPEVLPIDSLQITEDGEKLREFSVTLRNEKADSLLRQVLTIYNTEQGVSPKQVSTAINQALSNYSSEQESSGNGGGGGISGVSFLPQGAGNAVTNIVESTPGVYIFKKEKGFVDLDSAQTITGAKKLKSVALLNIPSSSPASGDMESGKVYFWCDTTGVYGEVPSGGGGGVVGKLYVHYGNTVLTYDPATQDQNIDVPTNVSDLNNDSGFLTAATLPTASASTLGGIKVGSGLSINASTGVLSATYSYTLPIASASTLGGVKVGSGLSIDENGVLAFSADLSSYAQKSYVDSQDAVLAEGIASNYGRITSVEDWLRNYDIEKYVPSWALADDKPSYTIAEVIGGTAIGGATTPVYYNGSAFVAANAYSTILSSVSGGALSSNGNLLSLSALNVVAGGTTKSNAASSSVKIINSLSVSTLSSTSEKNLSIKITINGQESAEASVTDLYADKAARLEGTSAYSAWGQEYWANGVPKSISGALTGVTDITASGLATLPSIHAATSLSIPKIAPDSTASWYDSSRAYLWSDANGVYSATPSGGGGTGDIYKLHVMYGQTEITFDPATQDQTITVPTALADLSADATHRVVTDAQIAAWGAKYDKPSTGIPASDLAEAYLTSVAFSDLTSHPTTIAEYGITDAHINNGVITLGSNSITPITSHQSLAELSEGVASNAARLTSIEDWLRGEKEFDWDCLTGTPTTLAGYGITDAKIASGVITLGANTITPLVSGSMKDLALVVGTATIASNYNALTARTYTISKNHLTTALESDNGYYVKKSGDTITGHLAPSLGSAVDLGASLQAFRNLYVTTIATDSIKAIGGYLILNLPYNNTDYSVFNAYYEGTGSDEHYLVIGNSTLNIPIDIYGNVNFHNSIASHLNPSANNTYDLGSSSYKWKNIYLSGDANIGTLYALGDVISSSDISSQGDIEAGGNFSVMGYVTSGLIPSTTFSYTLGNSSYKWQELYVGDIYADSDINALGGVFAGSVEADSVLADSIEATEELIIPTSAPSSPANNKHYLWFDTTGNYAVVPSS